MNGKQSFIEQMRSNLLTYQLDRIHKQESTSEYLQFLQNENKAKEALIEANNESVIVGDQEEKDEAIGRWGKGKKGIDDLPPKLIRKRKNENNWVAETEIKENALQKEQLFYLKKSNKSLKVIPQLKTILQKLSSPINKKKDKKIIAQKVQLRSPSTFQVLLPSSSMNKLERYSQNRQSLPKSQRVVTYQSIKQVQNENRRPPTSNHSSYKRISRKSAQHQPHFFQNNDIIHQKQILSQLIKGNVGKISVGCLTNLGNYFSVGGKKKSRPFQHHN